MSLLITGASGFVGRALCRSLQHQQRDFFPLYRSERSAQADGYAAARLLRAAAPDMQGEMRPDTDWQALLADVQVVLHLAARVHVMHDQAGDPLAAYRYSNRDATLNLARQAAAKGVKRFVFVSSIKVNGEMSLPGQPFTAAQAPQPQDPYGVSKWEAEQGLRQIGAQSGMEIVVVRPPLVYGPGVKANFLQLMRWVEKGVPLPLKGINNRRSMVYLGNLVDLLQRCAFDAEAAGQTFLVSDGHDVSSGELIGALAQAMGKPARLWPMPPAALRLLARLAGRTAALERLSSSLQVDIEATCRRLQWQPPFSLQQGLAATVAAMAAERS